MYVLLGLLDQKQSNTTNCYSIRQAKHDLLKGTFYLNNSMKDNKNIGWRLYIVKYYIL